MIPNRNDGDQDGGDEDDPVVLSHAVEVVNAAWGSGSNDLGHRESDESSPEGPMSFAVAADGSIHILDQVNRRVQVFSAGGARIHTIPISGSTFSDIDFFQTDHLVLLDPWSHKAIVFIDQSGRQTGNVSLIGKGITESGSVLGLYVQADGVWVNSSGDSVRVADSAGRSDPERPVYAGRLSRDGNYLLSADILGEIAVTVTRKQVGGRDVKSYTASFDLPVLTITLVVTDQSGNIYLGVTLLDDTNEPPYTLEQAHEEVVVFNASGPESRRLIMPISSGAAEVTRSLRVTADGTVYQLVGGENGASLRRYDRDEPIAQKRSAGIQEN